ncbi:UNVERIFIED_CONTAM: hypothetical protein Sangu_1727800 [Sesamum angustifolium]|uniref:Ty1-copia retrotransposon protein n=1 Tax=Sesamum angustifolium TaxID=2727405 RepID=A0AAW2M7P2_9LAMI
MRTEEANREKDKKTKFQKADHQKLLKGADGKIQKPKQLCYCCGKSRHKAYQCYQRKDQQKTNVKPVPRVQLIENEEVIAAVVVEANLMENKADWILDMGVSKHFYSNKELFQKFHEASDGECVFVGNFATPGILGMGILWKGIHVGWAFCSQHCSFF